jgi:hypothetical protein
MGSTGKLLIILPVVLLLNGCSQLRDLLQGKFAKADIQFQVTPAKSPGHYEITGKADLPDRTEVRVAALRYLYPTTLASQSLNPKPTYSILAYQNAKVDKGKWQTQLNLWQAAPDGRWQEYWQLHEPKLKLPLKPDNDVVFLVTLALGDKVGPIDQVQQSLRERRKDLDSSVIRQNLAGDRFLQVTQVLPVALPTGSTAPPPLEDKDINGGWGRRYIIPPEEPNPNNMEFPANRRTNANPAIDEFVR